MRALIGVLAIALRGIGYLGYGVWRMARALPPRVGVAARYVVGHLRKRGPVVWRRVASASAGARAFYWGVGAAVTLALVTAAFMPLLGEGRHISAVQRKGAARSATVFAARPRRSAEASRQTAADDPGLLRDQLFRATSVSPVDFKKVLRTIGAVVPDERGRFPEAEVGERVDWLAALLALDDRRVQPALLPALRQARHSVALMRALAKTRHTEAATALLLFAYRHRGAFRDECGHLLRTMGDHAIPTLIRAKLMPDPQAYRMVRYAGYQLDRMDRARPDKALRQIDACLEAKIVRAYGATVAPAAVGAVVERTDDARRVVREAARWATLQYVTGPPPEERRRHLTLPGGRSTDEEQQLYLNYRQLAVSALSEALAAVKTPSSSPDQRPSSPSSTASHARALALRLFSLQDQRRERRVRQRLDGALKLADQGNLEGATAQLDQILAVHPDSARLGPMAAVFQSRASQLLRDERYTEAALVATKAAYLLPPGSAGLPQLRALRIVAEALRDGLDDSATQWHLRRAAQIAPGFAPVHEQKQIIAKRRRWTALGLAGSVSALALVLLPMVRRKFAPHKYPRIG